MVKALPNPQQKGPRWHRARRVTKGSSSGNRCRRLLSSPLLAVIARSAPRHTMHMTDRRFLVLQVLAEHGTITAKADVLGDMPSAVSAQMRSLARASGGHIPGHRGASCPAHTGSEQHPFMMDSRLHTSQVFIRLFLRNRLLTAFFEIEKSPPDVCG